MMSIMENLAALQSQLIEILSAINDNSGQKSLDRHSVPTKVDFRSKFSGLIDRLYDRIFETYKFCYSKDQNLKDYLPPERSADEKRTFSPYVNELYVWCEDLVEYFKHQIMYDANERRTNKTWNSCATPLENQLKNQIEVASSLEKDNSRSKKEHDRLSSTLVRLENDRRTKSRAFKEQLATLSVKLREQTQETAQLRDAAAARRREYFDLDAALTATKLRRRDVDGRLRDAGKQLTLRCESILSSRRFEDGAGDAVQEIVGRRLKEQMAENEKKKRYLQKTLNDLEAEISNKDELSNEVTIRRSIIRELEDELQYTRKLLSTNQKAIINKKLAQPRKTTEIRNLSIDLQKKTKSNDQLQSDFENSAAEWARKLDLLTKVQENWYKQGKIPAKHFVDKYRQNYKKMRQNLRKAYKPVKSVEKTKNTATDRQMPTSDDRSRKTRVSVKLDGQSVRKLKKALESGAAADVLDIKSLGQIIPEILANLLSQTVFKQIACNPAVKKRFGSKEAFLENSKIQVHLDKVRPILLVDDKPVCDLEK